MIQKYVSVLQRYFVQYLCGFDVTVLKEVVQVSVIQVNLNRRGGVLDIISGGCVCVIYKVLRFVVQSDPYN